MADRSRLPRTKRGPVAKTGWETLEQAARLRLSSQTQLPRPMNLQKAGNRASETATICRSVVHREPSVSVHQFARA
jgi:hypothetical protein